MTDHMKLTEILMDELPEEHPWKGNIKGLVERLIANGVTVQKKKRFLLKENGDLIPLDQEWISVKDRLPEKDKRVIAFKSGMDRSYIFLAKRFRDKWFDVEWNVYRYSVTHWMPLPQPPKGETIYCKDCENLMFSDCYGECAKGHKGIVSPNDTCEHAKRKPPKGE